MKDTINSLNNNHSKARIADVLTSTKSSNDGLNGVDANASAVSGDSFQDSIRKAHEVPHHDQESAESPSGGNDMPFSGDSADITANDGRSSCLDDCNKPATSEETSADQLSARNTSMAPDAIANMQHVLVNIETNDANRMNILSSKMRQYLMNNPEDSSKTGQITGRTAAVINVPVESDIMLKDISQQNMSQIDLSIQKGQLLTMATQQHQMLSSHQSLLISQTAAIQADVNNDSSPLLFGSSGNIFSTNNLHAIPQAEIVETFARPQWSQGMGKQILWMVNQNISSAEIRLNPAHLGPIEVLVDMKDDQVNVMLSSRHAIVREAMEQALPKLREMLEANGFNLAETDVSQQSFGQQREHNMESNHRNKTNRHADRAVISEANSQPANQVAMSAAMVDYYI